MNFSGKIPGWRCIGGIFQAFMSNLFSGHLNEGALKFFSRQLF